MDDDLRVTLPRPQYAIGTTVIALVNYKPRVADILEAHLATNIVVDAEGPYINSPPRWEYDVRIYHEDTVERMVISERTIITIVDPDDDEESA